jgi:hypothetical protein
MDATTEAAEAPAAAQPPAFLIEAAFAARTNLADYQNAVPVLRELSVTNHTEAAVPGLVLSLESAPPVLTPRTWRLDALGAKQQYRVTDLGIALDGAALARLTEAELARVAAALRRADAADVEPLARWEQPIELLPRHHWAGISATPDMVAAFVQPNEPGGRRAARPRQAARVERLRRRHQARLGAGLGAVGCRGDLGRRLRTAAGQLRGGRAEDPQRGSDCRWRCGRLHGPGAAVVLGAGADRPAPAAGFS